MGAEGEATENTLSGMGGQYLVVGIIVRVTELFYFPKIQGNTYGEDGSSRRVAEISASMIWPGVISIGIPRPGVLGRGGELTFEFTIIGMNRATVIDHLHHNLHRTPRPCKHGMLVN